MKLRSLGNWARTSALLLASLGFAASSVGACAPVAREFPDGQGGSGGTGQVCEPLTTAACYTGTPGTEDVGVCKQGTHTCLEDGSGYGPCEGEVVPTTEICTTVEDEGCDGPNPVECPSLGHVWSKSYGGLGEEVITSIAVDPTTGDVIGTGYFRDVIDFGGGPMASTGGDDIFLFRVSALGEHIWSKRFGDSSYQTATDLALDASGAIYIVGEMSGAIDFGDGNPITSNGGDDAFVAKFDPSGTFMWARHFGDQSSQRGKSIAITPANQVIVAGNYSGFIQLMGMELPTAQGTDMFVLKLDSSGFDIAAKKYGGTGTEELMDIAVDSKGAIFITGAFADIADFGQLGGYASAGSSDAFLLKLAPDLAEDWVRTWGDAEYQRGGTVATSATDDVFVMGDLVGSMMLSDGTTLSPEAQSRGVFLMSLGPDGSHRWAMSTGNAMSFFARQMMTSDPSSQSIVAVGFYDGTLDFGGGPLVANVVDGFIAKIGWDGKHISSTHLGGPALDAFFGVAVSPVGDVFVSGGHQGPADFGGGVLDTPAGMDDIQALLMRLLP